MSFLIFYCIFSEILFLSSGFYQFTSYPPFLRIKGWVVSRNKIIKIISTSERLLRQAQSGTLRSFFSTSFLVSYENNVIVDDIKRIQKTSATSHNYTTHSSVQHMIIIPYVKTTKFGLRSIHTKSKSP